MNIWCDRVVDADGVRERVRFTHAGGFVTAVATDVDPRGDDIILGTVMPGVANAHSHAFHRVLRGRTHAHGGDFWRWRESMYAAAARLDPDSYFELARAVFAEMVTSGYTAVGEFHYVHHRQDGTPYPYEMERAVAAAADSVGIRLTLLDTAYLTGGIDRPLAPKQERFSDGSAGAYLDRWHKLRDRVGHGARLGAAVHSVRAVPRDAIAQIAAGLTADVPLHVHLSEQPQENADCVAAYGLTPTELLSEAGVLSIRTTAVHATHLTGGDIALLGEAGVSIVMCPTTEADLGDGIGPARELLSAGARLAVGSDQNAVVDPFLETRGLEMHERLAHGARGRFTPAEILRAATADGYRSLGWQVAP
ncbi:formimidoylglutamate deiminase, partial [Microbacterium sp. HMWF026]|uniref:formimidoylglutamate deiminase n=1 Tax=Microbacterium sp. HMWF026 TaxID=2056861 RepID=UPI002159C7E4